MVWDEPEVVPGSDPVRYRPRGPVFRCFPVSGSTPVRPAADCGRRLARRLLVPSAFDKIPGADKVPHFLPQAQSSRLPDTTRTWTYTCTVFMYGHCTYNRHPFTLYLNLSTMKLFMLAVSYTLEMSHLILFSLIAFVHYHGEMS